MIIEITIDNNNDKLTIKGNETNLEFPLSNPTKMRVILHEVLSASFHADFTRLSWIDEDSHITLDEW